MDAKQLIEEIHKRRVIWDTGNREHNNKHKVAWRQICHISWPEFETLPIDQKRIKCLKLQKMWRDIKETFINDHHKEKLAKERGEPIPTPSQKYHDRLAFLVPILGKGPEAAGHSAGPAAAAKRRRTVTDTDETVASSTCGSSTCGSSTSGCSQETRDRDLEAEEDRLFLLSLLSFMQDVPRASKLALRADILALIGRYTCGRSDTTDSPQY